MNENINNESENKSSNIIMNQFLKSIEKQHNTAFCENIRVSWDENGKKTIHSKLYNKTPEEIKADRGNGNVICCHIKHIPDLYVIDFDRNKQKNQSKEDLRNSVFFQALINQGHACTETKNGFHFWIYIKNVPKYSNQVKVGVEENYDYDLLKINKCFEYPEINNEVIGELKTAEFSYFKEYFNLNPKLELKEPASPVFSNKSDETDIKEIKKYLLKLTDEYYEYEAWVKVGLCIHTCTEGSSQGQALWLEWCNKDPLSYRIDTVGAIERWSSFTKNNNNDINFGSLVHWAGGYEKTSLNPYQEIYCLHYEGNDKDGKPIGKPNPDGLIKHMNKELAYCDYSGMYIRESDDELLEHKKIITTEKYEKYSFPNHWGKGDINPFIIWCKHIKRRDIKKIVFNPDPDFDNEKYYNTFKGFQYTKEEVNKLHGEATLDADDPEIRPLMNHISQIICNQDIDKFEWFMKWLAHIVQKPHQKTQKVVVLKSEEGAGKGILWNTFLKKIFGQYGTQIQDKDQILGTFNSNCEQKIFLQMNEVLWGGDKSCQDRLKSLVTEDKIWINKKFKTPIEMDNHANILMDTNNKWACPVNVDSRRFNIFECDNEWARKLHTHPEEAREYFEKVGKCSVSKFAKILYDMPLGDFIPSKKTFRNEDFQEQVQQGWSPLVNWWYNYINDGGFKTDSKYHYYGERTMIKENYHTIEYNGIKGKKIYDKYNGGAAKVDKDGKKILLRTDQWLYKDFFYESYISSTHAKYKLTKINFWNELQKQCCGDLKFARVKAEDGRREGVLLPSIEESKIIFSNLQKFDFWKDEKKEEEEELDNISDDEDDDDFKDEDE